MQRKQQVGECWVCVIFFACVCVGVSDSTTASDDPSSSPLCLCVVETFLGGSQGGLGMAPLVTRSIRHRGATPNFVFFLLFLVDFSIFSGFLN
jgi:hypothetical protein